MTDLELGKQRAEELGLKPTLESNRSGSMSGDLIVYAFYAIDDIHKLLGAGTEVADAQDAKGRPYDSWFPRATHTAERQALLIGIRPIIQESREQKMEALLRALIAETDSWGRSPDVLEQIKSEVKALLNGDK